MKQFIVNFFSGIHEIIEEHAPEIIDIYQYMTTHAIKHAKHVTTIITTAVTTTFTTIDTFNRRHNRQPHMVKIRQMTRDEKINLWRHDIIDIFIFHSHVFFLLQMFHTSHWWVLNTAMVVMMVHTNTILNCNNGGDGGEGVEGDGGGALMMDAWYPLMQFEAIVVAKHVTRQSLNAYPLIIRHACMELLYTVGSFEGIHRFSTLLFAIVGLKSNVVLVAVAGLVRTGCCGWLLVVTVPAFLVEHSIVHHGWWFALSEGLVDHYRSSQDSLTHQGYLVPKTDYLEKHNIACLQDYFVMKRLRMLD